MAPTDHPPAVYRLLEHIRDNPGLRREAVPLELADALTYAEAWHLVRAVARNEPPYHFETLLLFDGGITALAARRLPSAEAPTPPPAQVEVTATASVPDGQGVVRYKQLDEIPARHWNDGNRSGELVTRTYIRKRYHISTATVTAYMEPTSQRDAILITRAKFGREDIFDYREVESMSDVCDEMKRQQVK